MSQHRFRGQWLGMGLLVLCLVASGAYVWHRGEQAATTARADAEAKARTEAAERAMAMRERRGERDCTDCPEMLSVPPGSFIMGSPSAKEGPQRRHRLELPTAVGSRVGVRSAGRHHDGALLGRRRSL